MKSWIVGVLVITGGVVSFGAGYWLGDSRGRAQVAEAQLGVLQHYVPAIVYLRTGKIEPAKGMLYTGVDGVLLTFSQDNAASLSEPSRDTLARLLPSLNAAWSEDRPFEGEKVAPLRAMPEWVAMREKNDSFRLKFATRK